MNASIRKFLLLNLLIAIIITTALAVIGSYYLDQVEIQHRMDLLLAQSALLIHSLVHQDQQLTHLTEIQTELNQLPKLGSIYLNDKGVSNNELSSALQFQVWNQQHHLILSSAHAPLESFGAMSPGFSDQFIENIPWRIFTLETPKGLTISVAEDYNVRYALARHLALDDLYMLFLTIPIAAILIWLIVGRGLSSISRVTREISVRQSQYLEPLDAREIPLEIKPLTDALNRLFIRLKASFEREQRFAADAAHELRTPLAALKIQTQVALQTSDPQELQRQLKNVTLSVDRCSHLVQQMLILNNLSSENNEMSNESWFNAEKFTKEVIAQLVPMAIKRNIELELFATSAMVPLYGNVAGFSILVRNLVDNAIRYSEEGTMVNIYLEHLNNQVTLRVVDSGPGIPDNLRARMFEPFYRMLGNNTSGSGLGLSIVQHIAIRHQATIHVQTAKSGKGLEVSIVFPKQVLPANCIIAHHVS